ncbi:hypothetical protein PGTUg99_004944 [Puccinia graminis f. sp. tritici]|uniref:Uncharacterized protein n=1 Tax=Puccinia graminis f. sp. tritici TaxID=56615 RepID=A0A5B0SMQ0_PUCGR|nr:hypothetical protein PGTUg99_004944 [Puccinia graminis f. sp. tritici]
MATRHQGIELPLTALLSTDGDRSLPPHAALYAKCQTCLSSIRLPLKDGTAVPEITVKQDVVVEQCYSIVRSHGETGWKDNHYTPGGSHASYNPDTGAKKLELFRLNSVPNHHCNNCQQTHFNQYNNTGYGLSNHQERRRDLQRSCYRGNTMQVNFPNSYNYNTNYNNTYHSQAPQHHSNFINNYNNNHPSYGGGYHQPTGDGRKRFRSSGNKLEANEKPLAGMASGSKPYQNRDVFLF